MANTNNMEYMSIYYTKEAECQEKSLEIARLKQRIHKLEEKVNDLTIDFKEEPYHLGTTDGMGE